MSFGLSGQNVSAPHFCGFCLKHTVGRKLTILGPASAVSCQKDTKEEIKGNKEKLLGIQMWLKFPSSHLLLLLSPPLHRRLLLPEVPVLVSSQRCGTFLAALLGERGLEEEEEEAVGLVCLSFLDKGQEVCQETCAMSLTRFWMSWRHSGHVSNCKAHSIHIPLEKDGGKTWNNILFFIPRKC